MAISKKDRALLGVIVVAMANEAAPFHMATEAELKGLLKAKLVETNPEIKDGDKLATRATEAGVTENGNTPVAAAPAPSPFEVKVGGLDLSAFAKRVRSNVTYPFDTMAAGGYFFVPASDEKPNPAKSLASTVSAATKKWTGAKDEAGADVPDRVFVIRPFKKDETLGGFKAEADGALVVRTV